MVARVNKNAKFRGNSTFVSRYLQCEGYGKNSRIEYNENYKRKQHQNSSINKLLE